ncbi:MAG TPA: hypothetical protein VK509_09025, partial [Polyangiales bacterium]|nr:hypothetical protein [Polyangiales bacterium]
MGTNRFPIIELCMPGLLPGMLAAGLLAVALTGCAAEPEPVDQVQENLVEKGIFEGDWWYSSTTINVNYDQAAAFASTGGVAPFEGSMSADYGVDFNREGPYVIGAPSYSFPIARIRWVIDEGFLFAYRSFELVIGGSADTRTPEFIGQPLAVFAIEDHIDIRQDYNEITGEETNVRVENTDDRRWYERKYMRVDWSQNLITQFASNSAADNELSQTFKRESTPLFVSEGTPGFPDGYQPQFVRAQDDAAYRFSAEWPEDEQDKIHYMSFVTQEVWSPGAVCLTIGGTCAATTVTLRNSFLRVPPE